MLILSDDSPGDQCTNIEVAIIHRAFCDASRGILKTLAGKEMLYRRAYGPDLIYNTGAQDGAEQRINAEYKTVFICQSDTR